MANYFVDAGNSSHRANRAARIQSLCEPLGLIPMRVEIDGVADLGPIFQKLEEWRAQAWVLSESYVWKRRFEIVHGAMKRGLPTMAFGLRFRHRTRSGRPDGLQLNLAGAFSAAGKFIDRILRGAKPADLSLEQPTDYELVINLKRHATLASRFRSSCCCKPTK